MIICILLEIVGPMKIKLHNIITSLSAQGAQKVLLRVLGGFDRDRFELSVISLTENVPMADQFQDLSIPVHVLNIRNGLMGAKALKRLVWLLKVESPHIVQTWMYHADLIGGVAAFLAGRLPVVWNVRHSNLDPGVNQRATLLTAKACALLSGWLPLKIVCCAEAARQSHVRFGYSGHRFKVIPNGFDLDTFTLQPQSRTDILRELGIADHVLVIGLVARFHPQKDHQNFIRAAGHFVAQYPNTCFLLAGDDINWDNRSLIKWIHNARIADKVHLLGRRNDLARLYSAFDIATSASLGEGFPNAVGEAMACGIPCVVTDVGDSALLVGDTGFVVPPQDHIALAEAWRKLVMVGSVERLKLGELAHRRIANQFSLDAMVDSYQQLYLEILQSASNPDFR